MMKTEIPGRGFLRGVFDLANLLPERRRRIDSASSAPVASDPINSLARRLHPEHIHMVITGIKEENSAIRTYRLAPDPASTTRELPFFRAGQYLSIKAEVDGAWITRPYSISSSPAEALRDGFLELTIQKREQGFFSTHVFAHWEEGTRVLASGPHGTFYHEPLRDARHVVGLAGGCGITPFRSMMKDVVDWDRDLTLTLIYGVNTPGDVIFGDELRALEQQAPDKLKVHLVCREPDASWQGETGLLTAERIAALSGGPDQPTEGPDQKSFFICGPPAFYDFLEKELQPWNLRRKYVRREMYGAIHDISRYPGYPTNLERTSFEVKVHRADQTTSIPASADEPVLVALERAGMVTPSECRSGECGFCDALLLSGDVFVVPDKDGRRLASRKFGHFHPCASYPISDLEIRTWPA